MPVYVYQIIRDDGQPGEQFELRQGIHDAALTHHPDSGEPVKRVIQPAYVAGSHSQMAIAKTLKSDEKLEAKGFTKYEKQSDGTYERTAGKDPRYPKAIGRRPE
jgi:predicted nucleic acid-binding Zn ribbon protein